MSLRVLPERAQVPESGLAQEPESGAVAGAAGAGFGAGGGGGVDPPPQAPSASALAKTTDNEIRLEI